MELAHTNVPGSRNAKRYQDVQDVLAAGIHVVTTMNVQHLESLYNLVENAVGVKVRERLPDAVLADADEIVDVDLTPGDLRKRLEEGKIYPEERVEAALNHFFTASNLEKLRELALRELASQIDLRRRELSEDENGAVADQVMVCLSSRGPNSEKLLRYASRLAGKLNRNWYAVYVRTQSEGGTPTGNCFSSDRILKIVEASPGIVVVDEAYQPFASDKGCLPLLKDYKNLVIMRTLSKIGLAALRFGFLVADEEIIHEVNKVRLPFNVNALSQAVAVEVLKDRKALRTVVRTIAAERDLLMRAMEGISTITTFPSEANFILFRVADPDRLHTELLRRGILIRNVADAVDGCLRVTVGTPRENRKFLHALRSCMEESS